MLQNAEENSLSQIKTYHLFSADDVISDDSITNSFLKGETHYTFFWLADGTSLQYYKAVKIYLAKLKN